MHGAKQAEAENAIKKSTFLLPKVRFTRLSVKAYPATNILFSSNQTWEDLKTFVKCSSLNRKGSTALGLILNS